MTYEELRKLKDKLPDGSIHQIADELNLSVETVRNYFGGYNFRKGDPTGEHFEKGYGGGYVHIEDPSILKAAQRIVGKNKTAAVN